MTDEATDQYINRVANALQPSEEESIIRRAALKKRRSVSHINGLTDRIGLLLEMLRDGDFKFTWTTRAIILAGLIYFITPADAIPDVIPIVGYVDDAAVISVVFRRLRNEIERYKKFLTDFE